MVRGLRGWEHRSDPPCPMGALGCGVGVGGQRLCCVHRPTQHSHPLQLPHPTGQVTRCRETGGWERDPEGAEALVLSDLGNTICPSV